MFKIFQRPKIEENKRPQQFLKRHASIPQQSRSSPFIDFVELSEREKPVYESWWRDLDPFNFEEINHQTVLKFLNGCSLEQSKLEQILALFDSASNNCLTKFQFFAMLRLIAHAQNGRKISPALVYLGAPIPHFYTNPIEATILQQQPVLTERKSWWGQSAATSHTTTYDINYHHSRSRSVGTASELFHSNPYHLYYQPQELHSSQSSLSLHDFNTSNLLLTQKFVYQSPSVRNRELSTNNNNPFYKDPFDDENSSSSSSSSDYSPILYHTNQKPNKYNIPPPPVPSQSTKPAFPKYTRTNYRA